MVWFFTEGVAKRNRESITLLLRRRIFSSPKQKITIRPHLFQTNRWSLSVEFAAMVFIESIEPITARNVLLFAPNLIGYFRVICTLSSLFLMIAYPHLWFTAVVLYVASFAGDLFGRYRTFVVLVIFHQYHATLYIWHSFIIRRLVFLSDGMVARKLNQTSTFGGLLDMVTDRCSTLGLLYVLGGEYASVDQHIGFPVFRCVSAGTFGRLEQLRQ